MELSSFLSRLPSIISTKPFYISPHHKPSPFRYRSRKNSLTQTKTMDNSRVSGHQKDWSKLSQLRFYIENTIQNQRQNRVQSLAKRKELDELELERKRQRVFMQRRRHQLIMQHMKEYLNAMKKYYWMRLPCKCGCGDLPDKTKRGKQHQSPNNPKKVQYRLNTITHFKSSIAIPKLPEESISRKLTNKSRKERDDASMGRWIPQQMKQTANSYFSLLTSLQKNVKSHLSSSTKISNLLQRLVQQDQKSKTASPIKTHSKSHFNSNPTSLSASEFNSKSQSKVELRKSIFNVLSLTKANWEDIFKNVVVLKGLETKLVNIAREHNFEVEYTEAEQQRKEMMDDMYRELVDNNQYLTHINKELKEKGVENEIKERLEVIEERRRESKADQPPSSLQKREQTKDKEKVRQRGKQRQRDDSSEDDYQDELGDNYYAKGIKAQIHQNVQDIIQQFMKNQLYVKQRKRPPRKTLLESLGIEHMVQRNSGRNTSALLNSSLLQDGRPSFGKRNSAVPTFKELVKRSFRLDQMKKDKDKKPTKNKKKKEKNNSREERKAETPNLIQEQKENIEVEEVAPNYKSKLRRNEGNFMNGIFERIVIPGDEEPESTLNPLYQRKSVFGGQGQRFFHKIKSKKLKKIMEQEPEVRHSQYVLELIDRHENIGIIKTRLIELFKHDQGYHFRKLAEQFLMGEDKMDENLQKLEVLRLKIGQKDDFNWIESLDYGIEVKDVDVMDLVMNEKVTSSMIKPEIERIEDLADFRVEKTQTRYELECQRKRLKAFCIENSYMKHRRQNSGSGELAQRDE